MVVGKCDSHYFWYSQWFVDRKIDKKKWTEKTHTQITKTKNKWLTVQLNVFAKSTHIFRLASHYFASFLPFVSNVRASAVGKSRRKGRNEAKYRHQSEILKCRIRVACVCFIWANTSRYLWPRRQSRHTSADVSCPTLLHDQMTRPIS